jgi:voltage-gated potassium channel
MSSPATAWLNHIGLGGVAEDERLIAHKWESTFRVLIVTFLIIVPVLWYLDQHNGGDKIVQNWVTVISWLIWLTLIGETFITLLLVNDKWQHIKHNWMSFPIMVLTFPMILDVIPYAVLIRIIQLILIARALNATVLSTQKLFQKSHLAAIVIGYFTIIVIAGISIHNIDPNVKTLEDGLWWAIVTMATLGYGDVVPTSSEGRLFASVIIILGAVFFSLLTAQIAAYMVGEDEIMREEEILKLARENQAHLIKITLREDHRMEKMLQDMSERIEHLEKLIELMQYNQRTSPSDQPKEPS